MGNLSQGMDACIGPSCALKFDIVTQDFPRCDQKSLLHTSGILLRLPSP